MGRVMQTETEIILKQHGISLANLTEETVLDKIAQGEIALTLADTVDDLLQIRATSQTVHYLSKKVQMTRDVQNKAAELTIKAERALGEFLHTMPKATGGQPYHPTPYTMSGVEEEDKPQTYAEMGITYRDASKWQTIANLPQDTLEEFIAETVENGRELTSGGVHRYAKNWTNKHTPPEEYLYGKRETLYKGSLSINNFFEVAKMLRDAIRGGEITVTIERVR
jgi:hypothetical protein